MTQIYPVSIAKHHLKWWLNSGYYYYQNKYDDLAIPRYSEKLENWKYETFISSNYHPNFTQTLALVGGCFLSISDKNSMNIFGNRSQSFVGFELDFLNGDD